MTQATKFTAAQQEHKQQQMIVTWDFVDLPNTVAQTRSHTHTVLGWGWDCENVSTFNIHKVKVKSNIKINK